MAEPDLMPTSVFRLVYDGDAVKDGEMDVSDLAPALLAVGQVARAAGKMALGESAQVKVRVKTLKEGSFDIWLDVSVQFWQQIRDILISPDVSAAKTLLELLFGSASAYGLVNFVLKLRGRSPEKVARAKEGMVEVTIDGVTFEVPELVFRLALDASVRAALDKMIADPLSKDGIDVVEVRQGHETTARIEKADGPYFRMPAISTTAQFETNHTKVFSIVSLSFKQGNKWRLSDGHGAAKAVTVLDEDFLGRVDRSEIRFAKGDVLICEVREVARQTAKGLKAEYEILRVLEHRPAGDGQPQLDFLD